MGMIKTSMALTPRDVLALARFKRAHGKQWKSYLRRAWMEGRWAANPDDAAVLHRLRNTHGPSWLASFRMGE